MPHSVHDKLGIAIYSCFTPRVLKREGMQLSIDGEIKGGTKIVTQKLGLLVYWGYWGSVLRILKFP